MAEKKTTEFYGPLYTPPQKNSLGAAEVGKLPSTTVPDPLKFNKVKK
ncbi:MAG: hypothetical protein ABIN58_07225 [candidate division WOR-3 bacterium]